MNRDVSEIVRIFNEHFAPQGIQLPPDAVAERAPGHLFRRGWHIGWVWGEQDGEEYLEFLSQHRMTDDERLRVFASGRIEDLDVPSTFTPLPEGASPEEIEKARTRSAERNRTIYAELRERGLLPPQGENLPALEVIESLASGRDERDR